MKSPDLVIIGAGAAGLMCAITAARRGRRVLVLERSNKVGKKILMSGGGRCNFTNTEVAPERFLSANPHFCISALSRYTQWDFIDWVQQSGIDYFEKETVNGLSGQLFCSESSKLILAMLMDECRHLDIEVRTHCEIDAVIHSEAIWAAGSAEGLSASNGGFRLKTNQGNFSAETLVVAAGGLSIPSLGGSSLGFELADSFGLRLLPRSAGLVPFTFTDVLHDVFGRLSGVSTEAVVGSERFSFREDILFTHRGLSGPAALQASSYWQLGEHVSINLLPAHDAPELLLGWKRDHPKSLFRTHINHLLPHKLVLELEQMWWLEMTETRLAEWPDAKLQALADQLTGWALKPAGTEGYRTAEVTLGGVDTRDLSSRTMESNIPGLFFIGEVVDVTGHLGGFNFQWAWSSGYVAGKAV